MKKHGASCFVRRTSISTLYSAILQDDCPRCIQHLVWWDRSHALEHPASHARLSRFPLTAPLTKLPAYLYIGDIVGTSCWRDHV